MSLKLYKSEKLCSLTAIDALFASRAKGALAFPLRMVWRENPQRQGSKAQVQFLVSVPKRKLRHAVDRVTMRRRIREAYRLNRHLLPALSAPIDLAFVYVASDLQPYRRVEQAMQRLLPQLLPAQPTAPAADAPSDSSSH
jgi:ribonuclease P protein component